LHFHRYTMPAQQQHTNEAYFKGFERSDTFERLWSRLQRLEQWRELAIRPEKYECDEEDLDLLEKENDDYQELLDRCILVRCKMNYNLPPIEKAFDNDLHPQTSIIPNAGLGLFYHPVDSDSQKQRIPKGATVCFYTGHIHNFQSARSLDDKSYLMALIGETLVDPRPVPQIKARYINDPLNEDAVNCEYCAQELRSAVVATRDIHPGEELYVSYGDLYWSQQSANGKELIFSRETDDASEL
jgi:hypothetical protein